MNPELLSRDPLPAELSLARVKDYCRVYGDEHDDTLTLLVDAAVEFVQAYTRQVFRVAQLRQVASTYAFTLAKTPIISVDSVEYFDGSSWQAHAGGYTLSAATPPVICFASPVAATSYRVTFTAGYADWPADLFLVVLQTVEENFDRRGTTPATAQGLKFSRSHQLALEQHASHHDAVKWV